MRVSPVAWIVRVRKGSRPVIPEHGLYDGKRVVQYIKVHENPLPGRNPTKVRKHRAPNIQVKSIFSPTLGGMVRTHITTSLMKKIDRLGGLDNYVMKATPEQLGVFGLEVKYQILQAALRRREAGSQLTAADLEMVADSSGLADERTDQIVEAAVEATELPSRPTV